MGRGQGLETRGEGISGKYFTSFLRFIFREVTRSLASRPSPLAPLVPKLTVCLTPPTPTPHLLTVVRIFIVLACVAWLGLVSNFFIGQWIGDFNAAAAQFRTANNQFKDVKYAGENAGADKQVAAKRLEAAAEELEVAHQQLDTPRYRMTLHFYVGVASSLLVVLVNSVTVTYFVGTSKWCKEVGETYSLSEALQNKSTLIKRRTFPWAVASMLSIVVLVLLGGLSDPSIPLNQAQPGQSANMVQWHFLMAMLTLAFVAFSFFIQALRITENSQAIGAILAEVRRIRVERGLPVGEAAA